jgi:transposase InsO family protein
MQDGRCRLGLRARVEVVRRRERGESFRQIGRALAISPATAHAIWHRWQAATPEQRASLSCLAPRRPVPRSCPWRLSGEEEQRILEARARTNYGPMRLAGLVRRHRATVWKVLRRHGVSRRRRSPRQTFRRYEWAQPGALLHIDAFSAAKFDQPGHWAHGGQRSERWKTRRAGKTVVIAVEDDHSRLVYAELHGAENARNVSATLRRGAAWMREQGCGSPEAVMSDNAKCYSRSHDFAQTLADLGARHIRIPPYTPRWNGKIERFFGTLDTEWAHGRVWPNSTRRDRALASFIRYYNRQRPHSAANGRAPLTRVQQV